MRRLNGLGFCGMTLALLARCRVPQVVLLTEQADPAQNGVYEVVLGSERRGHVLVRVGDPTRPLAVELGAGWAVADAVDPHGFSPLIAPPPKDVGALGEWLLGDGPGSARARALIIGSAEGQAAAMPWAVTR